ncbi:MAG TPA: hypothetical protein VHF05_00765 [Candidatus Paceibacterota bacterium]|jgi:hypothetical protein|nr:hypothetical protein [Candidatus Paceibacterota bacterium]
MQTIFIVSASIIFAMIALRALELKFQRPIILAHLSWPADKRLRVYYKKFRHYLDERIKTRIDAFAERLKERANAYLEQARLGGAEYALSLQESLRGKKALSRGSVSFFLLNISDYNIEKKKGPDPALIAESMPLEGTEALQ